MHFPLEFPRDVLVEGVLADHSECSEHGGDHQIEYSASPIHYIVGRDDTSTANAFITDLRNGELSRDLNDYGGFSPATSVSAEGLASPSWGYTFKIAKKDDGTFQGVYVGAGPYFSMITVRGDRSGTRRGVREPDAGLHSEHQLLHVEHH